MSPAPSIRPDGPPDVAPVRAARFQDPTRATLDLARVSARLSPALAGTVPSLLTESPDPDSAVALFDRLLDQCPAETVRLLERHVSLAHYAILIFGHSQFLGETLIQNPDLFQFFLKEKNLDRTFSREEFHESLARFRSRSLITDVSLLLSRFKRRQYVRIMLRDVLRISPLAETTAEISALADVLIEEALREAVGHLRRQLTSPQHLDLQGRLVDTPFAVLSLGKLGGNELNYFSDVDLMYIFGDGPQPPSAPCSAREYFIRLAQELTGILSRMTAEGPVFRIDLRLRPQGNEGELAISLAQALRYYADTAHDWEEQALIKVRRSAGDSLLAREFIRGVQPFVYTEKINPAAIKTALVAREKMRKGKRTFARAPDSDGIDVKIDPGGIRDIEFLVQCLQRVYGGGEPWLRSGGTLFSLQKLHDKRHISAREFHDLTNAYEFLRHLEHRLQLRQGRQTHRLPLSGTELEIFRRSLENYGTAGVQPLDFSSCVRQRMAAVAEIYRQVVYQQEMRTQDRVADPAFQLQSVPGPGPGDHSQRQLLERLAVDAPAVYELATSEDLSPVGQRNLFRLLGAMFTTSERYSMLLRHAHAIRRALPLLEKSEFLTQILIHSPEEIATLSDLGETQFASNNGLLFENLFPEFRSLSDPVFAYLPRSSASLGEKLALLRRHFRHRVFAVSARDIDEPRSVYESLTATTAALDDAIAAAMGIAEVPGGFAVMALGSLGSGEFDILSDADVLLVCDEREHREDLTRSVERMMQTLAAYTQQGMVSPVDARLRPRGGEGDLVITPSQLEAYCRHEAQAWEALMYTKLRFVEGSRELGQRAIAAADLLAPKFAADTGFPRAVREMRARLETGEKNFKTSPGALYDIDFLCSFLQVTHAVPQKGGNLRDRIWRCAAVGALDKADAGLLDHAAELLRTTEHLVRLVAGRAHKWLPAAEHACQSTEMLASRTLGRNFARGLEEELEQSCCRVREIFDRKLG